MKICYQSIGNIYSPFMKPEGMPIQPSGASGVLGKVEIFPKYFEGLSDLEGFSHIILLYSFHMIKETKLSVTPFLDSIPHGVFATRAPIRPNPIGLSIVKLNEIEGNILHIENVDILNGSPLLDIKPYVPEFDHYQDVSIGWLSKSISNVTSKKADERFL
jgi:tRNA-Thr(GGU) m(6)t(6)A37 methyltransferase TsaA